MQHWPSQATLLGLSLLAQTDLLTGPEPWWARVGGLLLCVAVLIWIHRDLTAKWATEQREQRATFAHEQEEQRKTFLSVLATKAQECAAEKAEWGKRFDQLWEEFCRRVPQEQRERA